MSWCPSAHRRAWVRWSRRRESGARGCQQAAAGSLQQIDLVNETGKVFIARYYPQREVRRQGNVKDAIDASIELSVGPLGIAPADADLAAYGVEGGALGNDPHRPRFRTRAIECSLRPAQDLDSIYIVERHREEHRSLAKIRGHGIDRLRRDVCRVATRAARSIGSQARSVKLSCFRGRPGPRPRS